MDEIVAENHCPERAFLSDAFCCHRPNDIANPLGKGIMAWIGLTVYKQRPVNVAAFRKLIPSERARNDNARMPRNPDATTHAEVPVSLTEPTPALFVDEATQRQAVLQLFQGCAHRPQR